MLLRVLLTTGALAAVSPPAHALTVAARGDATEAGIAEAYARPFNAATEIALRVEGWPGGLDTLRTRLPEAGWDLVEVDPEELAAGCGEGLFDKIDWSAVGGKDHYLAMGVSDCGVGAVSGSLGLAWDRDKLQAAPSWSDFWDVAKIPGKRGLGKSVRGALEFALQADGVAPGDVYKVLGTAEGVDRAFRKLDQLKPYIVWWQTPAEAAKMLSSGDVLMAAVPARVVVTMNRAEKRNFGVQFTGGLYEPRYWAVPKGAPNAREALQFLYFVGTPAAEARLFHASGDAGLAKGANDWLTPDMQALSPTFAPNLAAAIRMDNGFWHDNLARLRVRFESWMNP